MNYVTSVCIWLVIGIGAFTVFGIHPVKAVLVVLFGLVIELAFEIAVMLFLYTNDRPAGKSDERDPLGDQDLYGGVRAGGGALLPGKRSFH